MADTILDLYENIIPITECGCWIWTGSYDAGGYGKLVRSGKNLGAHRFSWSMQNGPIPDGMMICHRCDIKPCVNPDHLFLGTSRDNVRDMYAKNRQRSLHGPDNHKAKFTHDDIRYIRSSGESSFVLAERFGVTPTSIRRVWAGVGYKTTPGAPPVLSFRKRQALVRRAAKSAQEAQRRASQSECGP